jgi:NADH dehydrogenase
MPPQVVIVGGGFAGLHAARGLARLPVEVTIVDRKNHHTLSPVKPPGHEAHAYDPNVL